MVSGGGFVIIRFRADNPVVWFFHSHIAWLLALGLAAVMIEAPDMVQQTQQETISNHSMEFCTDYGLYASGNVAAGK